MSLSRRNLLSAIAYAPIAGGSTAAAASQTAPATPVALPDKTSFGKTDLAYLDGGSVHPMPHGARAVMDAYVENRALRPADKTARHDTSGAIEKFAQLVNADPEEIAFVQSTTAGEQMVLKALDIPASGGHVVVDTLHFFGSIPLYLEMERQGMDVTWVREKDGRIPLKDMKKAIRKGTKLVALSLVSTINGFEHDLKKICDIAHENGAYVYADIIHAAGCVPVDLHASGVDFAACASYKWLMGDFGLGFIYARKDLLPMLKRVNYGYYGMSAFRPHIYPLDPPGDTIAEYGFRDDASGAFAIGTRASIVAAALERSLDYILGLGVDKIQAHAQTLADHLKRELPRRGYQLMTPKETKTPLVACIMENARETLRPVFDAAKIRMTTSTNRFRASLSVFNDEQDVERLLAALPKNS